MRKLLLAASILSASPAFAATVTPIAASRMASSFGMNTQLIALYVAGTGSTSTSVVGLQELQYLGTIYSRDGTPYINFTLPTYQYWSTNGGIQFDVEMLTEPSPPGTVNLSKDLGNMDNLAATNPGSILAYEGANEFNANTDTYNGNTSNNNFTWSQAVDQASDAALHADSNFTNSLYVAATTASATAANVTTVGNHTNYVDRASWHSYYNNGQQPYANLLSGYTYAEQIAQKPMWFTETGCSDYNGSDGYGACGDTTTAPKLILNMLMDAIRVGAERVFFYELMDGTATSSSSTDIQNNFGFFNTNGTPKPQAIAMHNLQTLMADPSGSPTLTPLSYSLTGMTSTAASILFRKVNGKYDLVLWDEPTIWNANSNSEVAATTHNVTVSFSAAQPSLTIYDPVSSTTATSSISNAASIVVPVTDRPMILEISAVSNGAGSPSNVCTIH